MKKAEKMTDLKKNTQESLDIDGLSAKVERYKSALSHFTNGFFETNLTKDSMNHNGFSKMSEMTEFYAQQFEGEDRARFLEFMDLQRLIAACEKGECEQYFRFQSSSASGNWQEIMLLLSKDESTGDVMALHFIKDITLEVNNGLLLKEALDDAQKGEEAKNAFLFNISHDIRTPMNSILGFSALAKKHIDDRKRALDYLNKVDESGNQLLRMINEILDMSRIERGKVDLQMKPMNILDELKNSEGLFRDEMIKKGLRLYVYKKVTHPVVMCDHLRVKQIFFILLENAMKYTKPGGHVTFKVTETEELAGDKIWYEVKIKDTGVGMSEEFQKDMFGFFEKEGRGVIYNSDGVGLGLPIVKGLLELMGGRIEVHSAINEGTEFLVYIPLSICDGEEVVVPSVEINKDEFVGKRILLVEDNNLNREIAKELLSEEGFVVTEAEDGSVALEILMENSEFDVILMDVQMPYMDGYLTTQAIRSMGVEAVSKIPIIAMTANAFEEDRKKSFDAGMNDHIAKPIDLPKLLIAMKNVLG